MNRSPRPIHVLATVTFNANQLRSHLLPLIELPDVASITLVSDTEAPPLAKLRVVTPPRGLVRLFGRAGAKLLVCLWVARRERPGWVIGFNFVPHGFNARLVGALTRTKSLYHMIGGEREWLGGGWQSDNRLLSRLPRPVPALERILLALIRGCTCVATMGDGGRETLLGRGLAADRVRVLPPSVEIGRFEPGAAEPLGEYDVVNVASLIARKRTRDLVSAVGRLRERHPGIRVAVVGEGPLLDELRAQAAALGVGERIDFLGFDDRVDRLLVNARVFALTSEFEGLPVAMLEAMAAGVPPVVTAVGEIPGFVHDGETGFVVPVGDVEALAAALDRLLSDESLRATMSAAAAEDVRARASVEAVSEAYRRLFTTFA